MPTVLVIARQFPPLGSVGGSVRIVKIMKYLCREGWEFIVITQDPESPAVRVNERCDVLLGELSEKVEIVFVAAPISLNDKIPDHSFWKNLVSLGWGIKAIHSGIKITRNRKVDLISAGLPQMVNGLIAVLIARLSRTKVALDIKDDLVGGSMYALKSPVQKILDQWIERFIFNGINLATFVTENSLETYRQRYPKQNKHFYFSPNGCDLGEFLEAHSAQQDSVDQFIILTAASRYRRDYRDATPFLRSYAKFLEANPSAHMDSQVIFLGDSLSEEFNPLVDELGLKSLVDNLPSEERSNYISWLKKARLLFLVQPYGNTNSTAGTLYEYWASASAPVLLFSEKGSSRDLVEQKLLGKGFDFLDVDLAAEYIGAVYQAYHQGNPVKITCDGVEVYDRKNLALEMGEMWQVLLKKDV